MKSKWNLVIHDVGQHTVNIWVGTLFPDLRKPDISTVKIIDRQNNTIYEKQLIRSQWLRPFKNINNRFYQYLTIENLSPKQHYHVIFERAEQHIEKHPLNDRILAQGSFDTLPAKLNCDEHFVVALGSCFYHEGDNAAVTNAYELLSKYGDEKSKPHVKFFTGDQVYLDIGLDSLSPIPSEVRSRIADDYACTWQAQRKMLRNGANWFLADDHEYWNNYPNINGKNIYLWMITAFNKIKKTWQDTATCGVKNVQKVEAFRYFSIGDDISFCFVDLRSKREKGNTAETKLLPTTIFQKVIAWAETLNTPGVIVLPQILMAKKGKSNDLNLSNYTKQYNQLIQALAKSGHDIVCLSGDVHFGRIGSVALGNNGATLYEIVASPMSNLTGLEGCVSADTPVKVKQFPPHPIDGVPQQQVNYEKKWFVSTEKVPLLWLTSYRKTKEHFMTLAFNKTEDYAIKLEVQAWRIREQQNGLPKKEFKQPHVFLLN